MGVLHTVKCSSIDAFLENTTLIFFNSKTDFKDERKICLK